MSSPKTLAEKVWERHVVHAAPGEPDRLYSEIGRVKMGLDWLKKNYKSKYPVPEV